MRPRLSVSFKSGHLIYSNGENPPLIRKRGHDVASTLRCLSGKLLSAALASSLQNETAALGLHALTEAMSLLAPMVVGLECHLQCKTPPSRDLRASIHSERMLSLFKITVQCTVYNSLSTCVKPFLTPVKRKFDLSFAAEATIYILSCKSNTHSKNISKIYPASRRGCEL